MFWGGWIFQSPCDFKNWLAAQFSDLDGGKIKPGVGGSLFPRAYALLVVVVMVMRRICSVLRIRCIEQPHQNNNNG